MGRPKQYDRTDLLDRAVEVFRLHGYSGTTTAELVTELGVNRKTMYAEFGSKQGLFDAALERYNQAHLSRVLAPIEAPDAGVDAIRQAFDGYAAESDGWFRGRGCLMCNTAVERAALDPDSRRHVDAYLTRLTQAFRHALGNARDTGDVEGDVDLGEVASFFTMALIGVAALVRAEAPPDEVRAAVRVATGVLDMPRASSTESQSRAAKAEATTDRVPTQRPDQALRGVNAVLSDPPCSWLFG